MAQFIKVTVESAGQTLNRWLNTNSIVEFGPSTKVPGKTYLLMVNGVKHYAKEDIDNIISMINSTTIYS